MKVVLLKSNTSLLAGSPTMNIDSSDANQVDDENDIL